MTAPIALLFATLLLACGAAPEPAPMPDAGEPGQTLACPEAKCDRDYPYCCDGVCSSRECEVMP